MATPLPKGHKFFEKQNTPLSDANRYRRLVRQLLYLNFTRPDITYAVQQLSQFVGTPSLLHRDATIHVLRYLTGFFVSLGPVLVSWYTKKQSTVSRSFCVIRVSHHGFNHL